MTSTAPRILLISIAIASIASQGAAQCRMVTTGATCVSAPVRSVKVRDLGPPPVALGDILPRGKYSMVMNADYYGLPLARDGWVYYRIADDVYRVHYKTMEVLERATLEASKRWP